MFSFERLNSSLDRLMRLSPLSVIKQVRCRSKANYQNRVMWLARKLQPILLFDFPKVSLIRSRYYKNCPFLRRKYFFTHFVHFIFFCQEQDCFRKNVKLQNIFKIWFAFFCIKKTHTKRVNEKIVKFKTIYLDDNIKIQIPTGSSLFIWSKVLSDQLRVSFDPICVFI